MPLDEDVELRPSDEIAFPLTLILDEAYELLLKKHDDYGGSNISQAPFGPIPGLLVRMSDKMARAVNLASGDGTANYEPLEDTFLDLLNYSAIAVMCLRGHWPGVPKHA